MHVHANAAVSVDGKLATVEREQVAISGPTDFDRVDRLRADMDAVCVGVGTVLADDPSLSVPDALLEDGPPARVVIDSTGRTPLDARITSPAAPTYVLASAAIEHDRAAALEAAGVTVIVTDGSDQVDLSAGLASLEAYGIDRVLVEGGGEVFYSLFAAECIDTVSLFISPHVIGGRTAPTLVDGPGFMDRFPRLVLDGVDPIDTGVLCHFTVEGWADAPTATQSVD